MNLALLVGRWYQILGWTSVAGNVVSVLLIYWTGWEFLDLSFLLWLWIGNGIREGLAISRNVAVGVSVFLTLVIAMAMLRGTGGVTIGPLRAGSGEALFYLGGVSFFVVVAMPGLLMLHPKAWRWCAAMETHPLDQND